MVPKVTFPVALFIFQVLLLGLFAGYANYSPRNTLQLTNYPQFQDVHVMIFIGFGFLMTFLQKYGFGAVSYNLLLSAVTIQWATLINAWVRQRVMKEEGHSNAPVGEINLDVSSLMTADFTAAAVLITYGAVLGKATRLQLLIIAIFECVFFAINETIIMEYLVISDAGGSIVVHLFGAYFGLAVATVLQNHGDEHELESSNYQSDIFAMIGTLFLWVYWPSFNAGLLGDLPNEQNRALVNTYFSLAACVVTTFMVSSLVQKNFKLNMVHIQNATLAGGVAVGTAANLYIQPWGAMLIGMIAGIISTLGYAYITPFLASKLRIHDTCGVHNLHGLPAVFAGIVGAIAPAAISKSKYTATDLASIYTKSATRDMSEQGGYQFAAVCVAFVFAIVGGLITGAVCRCVDRMDENGLYNDDEEFEVPAVDSYKKTDMEMKAV